MLVFQKGINPKDSEENLWILDKYYRVSRKLRPRKLRPQTSDPENSDPENSDPENSDLENSDPENSDPSILSEKKDFHFFEKDLHCKFVSIVIAWCFMVTQCSEATARKKRYIYLLRFIAVASIKQ